MNTPTTTARTATATGAVRNGATLMAVAAAGFIGYAVLEDAGIPARVIDEVRGHEASSRAGQQWGSAMGSHYRHTTPEMAARVIDAVQERLAIVLQVAEESLDHNPKRSALRVF
jgi:hypothetical protein